MQKIKYDLNVLDKAIADMQKLAAKYGASGSKLYFRPGYIPHDLLLPRLNFLPRSIVQNDLNAAAASLSKTALAFGELAEATRFALSTARTNIMLVDVVLADEFRKDDN